MINEIIINIIFVVFPLLIYFFYMVYKNMKNEKESNLFLVLSLFSSLYLSLKFGNTINDDKLLLFCNIPIVVAYVKKKKIVGIFLSVVLIVYSYVVIKTDIILIMTVKYIIYFIIAVFCDKNKKYNLIDIFAVIQGFLLSFEYFFKNSIVDDINQILIIIMVVITFYLITFGILYLFEIADRISGLYLSYKELEQEKQIKTSLFKITHEIKNPIAVCKGYLDMFDCNNIEKSKKYINIMKQEIDRTLNIMNDFLELSKIKIEKEILDINMLIYDVADSISLIFDNGNIELVNNINEDKEIYIIGDYNRLKQVLINLFKNSYESIESEGKIIVNGILKKKHYIIEIIDNGIGMDKETLDSIKKAFYTTKNKGNGIGVTLSDEIIKAHNGELNYVSEKGNGTKTIISIPIMNMKKGD